MKRPHISNRTIFEADNLQEHWIIAWLRQVGLAFFDAEYRINVIGTIPIGSEVV